MDITGYQIIGAKHKWRLRYEVIVVLLEDATDGFDKNVLELVMICNKLAKLKDLEDKYNTCVVSQEGYSISEALKRKRMLADVSYQLRGYHSGRATFTTDPNRQQAYLHIRSVIVDLEEFIAHARTTQIDLTFDEDLEI